MLNWIRRILDVPRATKTPLRSSQAVEADREASNVNRYYGLLAQIQDAQRAKNYKRLADLSLASLSSLQALAAEFRQADGSLILGSIPCLEKGSKVLAARSDMEGLGRMRQSVAGVHGLEPWQVVVQNAIADAHLAVRLEEAIRSQPGLLQTEAKTAVSENDGRRVSNVLYWMEKVGRIRRVRVGRSYSLSLPGQEFPVSSASASTSGEDHGPDNTSLAARGAFTEIHRQRSRRIRAKEFRLDGLPFVPLPRAPSQWQEREAREGRVKVEGAEELFELIGDPSWELSTPDRLPVEERPDPAYRLHFSAQSGAFLVDNRGRVEAHPGASASVVSFGPNGERLAERPLSWNLYRLQVNPMGRGLIAVSSDHILHCYDEHLRTLVAFSLTDTPELQAAISRLGIADHELHRHIRAAALRPDGTAYLFTVVDEAFAVDIQARPLWGGRMPRQEGWERVGTTTTLSGSSADVDRALEIVGLSYPFATQDVKRRYRELAKRWHPDLNPGREEEMARKFREVAEAAELLSGLDVAEFSTPRDRAVYRRAVGEERQIDVGGVTLTMGMYLGGSERSVADWIYAASFGVSGGAYLAAYSGKIVETDAKGRPIRLFDTGSVPRRIADTGDYLYLLTDTRLYVIRGTTLARLVDVYDEGELVVGQTGFGLMGRKAFKWYAEDGRFLGGIRTKHPLRRVFPSADGWTAATRQHKVEIRGAPAWLEHSDLAAEEKQGGRSGPLEAG